MSDSNIMEVRAYSLGLGVIHICWIIFIIVWALGVAWTKRTIYRERSAERARYWLLLVIGYLLVIKSGALPPPFNWVVVPHRTSSSWGGVFLCVGGLVIAIWARLMLGRNWSGVITLKEGHELIERGPYCVVRHPIYTGILAMLAGTAIALGYFGGFIGFLLVFVSFWVKLKREEDLMLKHFPAGYAAYQRRVKRIIPFLV